MNDVRLQTKLRNDVKIAIEDKFSEMGLSLNDGIRFILTQLALGNITISISSSCNELIKYRKMLDREGEKLDRDIKRGKDKGFINIDDLMESLES